MTSRCDLSNKKSFPVDTQSQTLLSAVLSLSLEDRNKIGDMIGKSQMVDDQLMRQAFCRDLGINARLLRIIELPPEQFGRALVDMIIDNQKTTSWERLGNKLRELFEGRQLELLNQIYGRAKQPITTQTEGSEQRANLQIPDGSLIPLERISDNSIRKIEKRLREMNPTKTDVNMLATLYFTAQLVETKHLSEQIDQLTDELEHDPQGKQLTTQPRELFSDLFCLCVEIQNLLQDELQGEMLENSHVFGLNTRNSLRDVKKHSNSVLKALDDSSSGLNSAKFNEAVIKVCDTLPRMIEQLEKINAYIQKILHI